MAAGRRRRAARGRRAGARADLGDRRRASPTARCTRAATPACCSRAATAARRWELNRALWEHPTRAALAAGRRRAVPALDRPVARRPGPAALAHLRRRACGSPRTAARRWRQRQRRASSRATCPRTRARRRGRPVRARPRTARRDAARAHVHAVPRRRVPLRRRGRELDDIGDGPAVGLRLPAGGRPGRPRQRVRHPAERGHRPRDARRPRARLRDARRRRDAGRRGATACRSEHAYLTVLRQAFDRAGEGDGARAVLRRDVRRRVRLGRRGRDAGSASPTHLPPVYSVRAG